MLVLLLALAAPLAAMPAQAQDAAGRREFVDQVVAEINGRIVTESELAEKAARGNFRNVWLREADPERRAERRLSVMRALLEEEVVRLLIESEMERMGVRVSDEDVERALERTRIQARVSNMDEFRRLVEAEGMDWDGYRNSLRDEIGRYRFLGQVVGGKARATDADIEAEYRREAMWRERQWEFRAAHIRFDVKSGDAPEKIERTRARAEAVLAEALKPGADFAQLAALHSDAPSGRQKGGDLGWNKPGELFPNLESALAELKPGEVYPRVLRTELGFHVLRLTRKRPWSMPPLDDNLRREIGDRIQSRETRRQLRAYVERIRFRARVVLFPPYDAVPVPTDLDMMGGRH